MHHILFLQDLAVVMIVAGLATVLFRQLKQPVVLGYILAGIIVGPHTPPFQLISDEKTIETLAELGVIFLMFSLGLEFSLRKLKKVGSTALIAASLEIVIMIFAGYELGKAFGWNLMDSIFLGAILSISSTTIIIKALEGLNKTREKFAGLIFGILIVEDILAILMIALLSGFAVTGELAAGDAGLTILSLSAFLGALLITGLIAVPRLLNYVSRFKSNEMLLITVIALCFGVSLLTIKLGYSVALGAFLIGAIIAEARQIKKVESLMFPIRDLFSAVFFVSIGLLIDPTVIMQYITPILIITGIVITGKVISCFLGSFFAGNDIRTSLKVGMGLSQIGEFSFIIASLGLSLGVTSGFIYPIAVAVSALTTLSTPYLIQSSDSLAKWFVRIAPQNVLRTMETYSEWISRMGQSPVSASRKILRKVLLQISINLLLVTGIFIAFVFLHERISIFLAGYITNIEITKAILWFAAMLISLPLLIVIWKKIQALGMIISEISVSAGEDASKTNALRAIISNTVLIIGTGILVLAIVLLSSTLLPSLNLLLAALSLVCISGFLLYRSSIKVYAWGQVALKDTFNTQPDKDPAKETPGLDHPLLQDARLHTVTLMPGAAAEGKLISELDLRLDTGANIIGIERGGESIINPEPETELAKGDRILLIGYPEQLENAKRYFEK
jgi:CPA2 family monovalent cation:H+ antiporter-2